MVTVAMFDTNVAIGDLEGEGISSIPVRVRGVGEGGFGAAQAAVGRSDPELPTPDRIWKQSKAVKLNRKRSVFKRT